MAEVIKNQLLDALETALAAIADFKTVEVREPYGVDLGITPLPALYFYEQEETPGIRNRLALNELHLEMAIFAKLSPPGMKGAKAFNKQANNLAGLVHGVMFGNTPALRGLVLKAEEVTRRPAISNEIYGEVLLVYHLTYGHALGNAFSQAY
jgi:hypothetical protein